MVFMRSSESLGPSGRPESPAARRGSWAACPPGTLRCSSSPCVVWGYNWVPLKLGATAIDPWWFGAWRVVGGSLTLFVVLALARRSMAPPPGAAFIAIGVAQVGGLVAFSTLALHYGGIANVTALIFTMPVFTALFSYAILAERLSRARIGWLVVAAAGIGVVASGIRTPTRRQAPSSPRAAARRGRSETCCSAARATASTCCGSSRGSSSSRPCR